MPLREVYGELIAIARRGETANYSDIAFLAEDYPHLFRILDRINRHEHRAGRPLLSAVVVGSQGMPGRGFFELARTLGLYVGDGETQYWSEELERVHKRWAPTPFQRLVGALRSFLARVERGPRTAGASWER